MRISKLPIFYFLFISKIDKFILQIIKRTFYLLDAFCAHMGIYFGGFATRMSQKFLNLP
jgi:hypothetical protein